MSETKPKIVYGCIYSQEYATSYKLIKIETFFGLSIITNNQLKYEEMITENPKSKVYLAENIDNFQNYLLTATSDYCLKIEIADNIIHSVELYNRKFKTEKEIFLRNSAASTGDSCTDCINSLTSILGNRKKAKKLCCDFKCPENHHQCI